MITLAQLSEHDFAIMAQEINEISESKSENELYEIIGNALHDSGMTVSDSNNFEIIMPKAFDEKQERFSMLKAFNFVADTESLTKNKAEKEGRDFWDRFKDKLKTTICTNPQISALFNNEGKLKDYLIAGIPLILAALGIAMLSPVWLAVIAAVFALIMKVGFKAYCEID